MYDYESAARVRTDIQHPKRERPVDQYAHPPSIGRISGVVMSPHPRPPETQDSITHQVCFLENTYMGVIPLQILKDQ